MTDSRAPSHPFWLAPLALGLLTACGSGGGGTGDGGGDPGNGGGPGGGGSQGNPLDIALEFEVHNDRAAERTETLRASIPFPKGGYTSTANLIVSGFQTAWVPMQTWPDGTIKMAQAQFTDTLAAQEEKHYTIARDETALSGPFTRNAWVVQAGAGLQFGAYVADTFNVPYRALAAGAGTVVQETPLVQVKRWHTFHSPMAAPGIGRDYLTSTFYVTEFRDMPFVVVDWVFGNDYLGADNVPASNTNPNLRPLGAVDVNRVRFLCKGMTSAQAYRAGAEGIGEGFAFDGFTAFQVMDNDFIDDAQTRRYRFLLQFEPGNANAIDIARWRAVADSMIQKPLFPLATKRTWQETEAAGLLGGPITGPDDSGLRARGDYQAWTGSGRFGTWGDHGDIKITATTGTPRNHPLSPELAHAIQGNYPRMLQQLEAMAWAQAMRPYHLWNLHVGAEDGLLLWDGVPMYPGSRDLSQESLGRRALVNGDPYPQYRTKNVGQPRAHGWDHFDHEHWSMDLLFDYWCISADPWAKEEIRQLGESLKALMRLRNFATAHMQAARAEGWCMQGFAQVYQTTQEPAIKYYAMRRVNEIIDVERQKNHACRALAFQSNYAGTYFPLDHQFFMPWQHGAVLYGFLGAYKSFDEPILLTIAEDVVTMLNYSWVTNYNDPHFGHVAQGLRYYVPISHNGTPIPANYWDNTPGIGIRWGDSPLGGAHTFLTGSLFHLAALTNSNAVRTSALNYGGHLLGTLTSDGRWNKWDYCLPPGYDE
ncbi:MAG: hypothetical protein KDE27_08885, partial [Planctomycetes bacterium]|nr:hypothetical protein [Planctomycetota bacterium]